MKQRSWLLIEALDPLVLTADSATSAAADSLTYLPGSALLGAAAGRVYGTDPALAWRRFHSAGVVFGDGLPLSPEGRVGWPAPLSLHQPKTGADDAAPTDLATKIEHRGDTQWRQLRHQARASLEDEVGVPTVYRLKTAIDPATGRAAQSQLFMLEGVAAGTRFLASVEADDPDDLKAVMEPLCRPGLRLGRSRGAEFGRVRVTRLADVALPSLPQGRGQDVFLWALSDIQLRDGHGAPRLEPHPEDLGFAKGQVCWKRSFLRFRRYTPYNAAWRTRGLERQVIERGSVIVFEGVEGVIDGGLRRIGVGRETGQGWVAVSSAPPGEMLTALRLHVETPELSASQTETVSPTRLSRWLEARAQKSDQQREARQLAQSIAEKLKTILKQVDDWNGGAQPPSASQWHGVANALSRVIAENGDLRQAEQSLFGKGKVIRDDDPVWTTRFRRGRDGLLSDWLKSILKAHHRNLLGVVLAARHEAARQSASGQPRP